MTGVRFTSYVKPEPLPHHPGAAPIAESAPARHAAHMARLPRFDLPGIPQHIVQRGNNRLPCFLDDANRTRYPRLRGWKGT